MKKLIALFLLLASPAFAGQTYNPSTGTISSLTTIGTSGASTYTGGVLNIPIYSGGGGGGGTVTSVTFTGDGTVLSSTPSSAVTTSGTLTATLATQTANTVLGALTATTPSDLAVPSCSAATSALIWTSGTGFGCHTVGASGAAVNSVSGDGTIISNSSSTGAVTLTLANGTSGTGAVALVTTPTFLTNITDPLVIGGTGASSTLTLESKVSTVGSTVTIGTQSVGIGTTAVSSSNVLSVNGAVTIGTSTYPTSAAPLDGLLVKGHVAIGTPTPAANSIAEVWAPSGVDAINFRNTTGGAYLFVSTVGSNIGKIGVYNAGFQFLQELSPMTVGDNSATPSFGSILNVAGGESIGASYEATAAPSNGLIVQGNVGIGTTSLQNSTTLQVKGTIETGVAGTTLGSLLMAGNTSGVVSIIPQAAAGTYNFNLPTTAGSSGQALLSGGGSSAAMTWGTVATGSGGTPTCGTGCASITAGSTDLRGSMVSGSSVSAVTLNFSGTLASAPFCTISDSNTSATADISSISSSALTVSLASALTSVTIYWNCPL
jgi:hypothetical protein